MIELNLSYEQSKKILNLTYEQSKKILELGYDFNEVCLEFQEIKTNTKFKRVNETQAISDGTDLNDLTCENVEWHDLTYSNTIGKWLIPIIPKAALEACLPACIVDWKQKRTFYLSYDGYKTPYYRKSYEKPDGTIGSSYTAYESAYKAFLWCHENYQEELKNKFEEVMK